MILRYWKLIILLLIAIVLFTAAMNTRPDNLPQDETPLEPLPHPTIIIEEVATPQIDIPATLPELSGYQISYVNEDFDKHLVATMKDFNINLDASYVYATIFCESTFRPTVESSAGAVGYMQVLPSTRDYMLPMLKSKFPQYAELSRDLYDPYTNVIYGLFCFNYLASNFGESEVNEQNLVRILTCYNKGLSGGKKHFNSTGYWNTGYTDKVLSVAEQIRTNGGI